MPFWTSLAGLLVYVVRKDWHKPKARLQIEGSESVMDCLLLKLDASDGYLNPQAKFFMKIFFIDKKPRRYYIR